MRIKQKKTIADKVNELLLKRNSSDESSTEEAEEPRFAEFDEDEYELPQAQTTEFRKRNVKLLSEQSAKYKGKVSSRKEFEEDGENFYEASDSEESDISEEHISDAESNDGAFTTFAQKLQNLEENKSETRSQLKRKREDSDDDDAELSVDDEEEEEEDEESEGQQKIFSATNREAEVRKAVCVQNQLHIWERLLEMRIQSQKIITKANQLPDVAELKCEPNIAAAQKQTVQNVGNLLNKLCEWQQSLGEQNPEVKQNVNFLCKPIAIDDASDYETLTKHFAAQLQENFEKFRIYRDKVLLQWDDRTRLMTAGSGKKRKSEQDDYNILQKIEHALNSRLARLETTQMSTAEQDVEEAAKKNTFVYDDTDFYHQQLREFIEYKSNTSSLSAEVTNQYMELQKCRQKMKKKVDTRASKGRKIRYVVHKKLVNFMAPEETSTWTEQSKDELYKSLFAV